MSTSIRKVTTCLILGVSLLGTACAGGTTSPQPSPTPVSQEASMDIAREFLTSSPTFRFDGMPETLKMVAVEKKTLSSPDSWAFIFEFQSRAAGYGDRIGQVMAQVITPHRARVVVQGGKVVSATMDDKWDELHQKAI